MEIRKGIATSPGISIAEAWVIDSEDYHIPSRAVEPGQRMAEVQRVRNAFKEAVRDLTELAAGQDRASAGKVRDIFAVHLRFLRDRRLRREITDMVHSKSVTAESAVSTVLRRIAEHFSSVKDAYISERAADIHDIERRLMRALLGRRREDAQRLAHPVVVVARELSPTQTASLDRQFVQGIATDTGGRTSHSAIVARSLGIPAVVALEDFSEHVRPGDRVIVDGNRGIVIANPDPTTVAEYQKYLQEFYSLEQRLAAVKEKPALTRDGARIHLLGNIEFPEESEVVRDKGGDGIGLYRTEFLYLSRDDDPTEDDHYKAYAQTIRCFRGCPVVIRTLDLGADKYSQRKRFVPERNPMLGLRSIRYCLQNLPLFKTQLRAILRASAEGKVKIMFPLITHLQELRQAKLIVRDVMEDLDDDGIPYDKDVQIGIMVETPAAALTAASLARESDFFSIGTNDLTQYTLAVDRANELVSTLYSAVEPAVLRLLRTIVQDATKAHIEVSVCGEMASEPEYVMVLLGLGIRTLSVTPPMIPEIKQIIRSVTLEQCHELTRKVIAMNSERQISSFLRSRAREILPEAF